jgi:NADH-quinone oxidoreductase subunit I
MKLTNRSKVVSNKEMTLAEKIYLPAIFTGMGITFKHAVRTVIKVLRSIFVSGSTEAKNYYLERPARFEKRRRRQRKMYSLWTLCGSLSCRSHYDDCC